MLITLAAMWKMQHFCKGFPQVSMHYTSTTICTPISCLRVFKPYDQRSALYVNWAASSLTVVSRVNSDSKSCQSRAGNMSPQELSVGSAMIARLVKYNAFGEGKHVVLTIDEALHSGEQKLNMMIVSCIIELQGVKALCCHSATRSAVCMLGVCHAGVSSRSLQDVFCNGHFSNYNLMRLCIGKSHNATPMDPLVVARHETGSRYCMYAGPYSQIACVSDVWVFLCHELLLLMGHSMIDHLTLAIDTGTYCLAISLPLLHLFGQSH